MSQQSSLTKHKFKEKIIKNSKTATTEHYAPYVGSFWAGGSVWSDRIGHIPWKPSLAEGSVRDGQEHGSGHKTA